MNVAFKALFSFTKAEIDRAFAHARLATKTSAFKLLQSSIEKAYPADVAPLHGKLLIIISRKSGLAHKRNRLRRQLKAIFYEEKLFQKRIISILICYKAAMNLSFDELKNFLIERI